MDHALFFKRNGNKITSLNVYINDMIIKENDAGNIILLKENPLGI